jgi:hypothetical protein
MTDDVDRDRAPRTPAEEPGPDAGSAPELPAYAVIQQQLIAARDRLDREVFRLTRMQAFNGRALRLDRDAEFVPAIGEAIVDIFELEFGICWLLDESGRIGAPIGVLGLEVDARDLHETGLRLASHLAREGRLDAAVLAPEALAAIAPTLPIGQAVCASCLDAGGRALALLMGGNTVSGASFFDPITTDHCHAVGLFAQQLAALVENRRGRVIIGRQLAELEWERSLLRTVI